MDAAEEADPRDARIAELEKELGDLKDRSLRALADAENARTIAKRDVDNAKVFAITKFAKSLLDTADNLALATHAVTEEV